jgi:hypothetical protein
MTFIEGARMLTLLNRDLLNRDYSFGLTNATLRPFATLGTLP